MSTPARRIGVRAAAAAAAAVALALTFLAYLSPHLALELATRLWACF